RGPSGVFLTGASSFLEIGLEFSGHSVSLTAASLVCTFCAPDGTRSGFHTTEGSHHVCPKSWSLGSARRTGHSFAALYLAWRRARGGTAGRSSHRHHVRHHAHRRPTGNVVGAATGPQSCPV